MPTTVNEVAEKTEMLELDPKSGVALKPATTKDEINETAPQLTEKLTEVDETTNKTAPTEDNTDQKEEEPAAAVKDEDIPVEVEPKTGISFPVKLCDGKQLTAVGLWEPFNNEFQSLCRSCQTKIGSFRCCSIALESPLHNTHFFLSDNSHQLLQ